MMKDRNSFQILLVLSSYQIVFPFAGCVEFLCPSSTQSIFMLFSASYESVLQQNHKLNWGRSQKIQLQRFSCHSRMPANPIHSHCLDGDLADGLEEAEFSLLSGRQVDFVSTLPLWIAAGTIAVSLLVRTVQGYVPAALLYTQLAWWWRWLPLYVCTKNL